MRAGASCRCPLQRNGTSFLLPGFSRSIISAVIGLVGRQRAMPSIVLVCAILAYGGVPLFVVIAVDYVTGPV